MNHSLLLFRLHYPSYSFNCYHLLSNAQVFSFSTMASESKRVIVVTGAARGLGVGHSKQGKSFETDTAFQLEWVRQLSSNPENLIIALVRNPDSAHQLKPLLGTNVVAVRGDVVHFDSFPVWRYDICCVPDLTQSFQSVVEEISNVGGGKVDWLIKYVESSARLTELGADHHKQCWHYDWCWSRTGDGYIKFNDQGMERPG
jgi:hypothetical protein